MCEQAPFQELIHSVSHTCDVAKCQQILASGVDVNATTPKGCTALMLAVTPNEYGDHNAPHAILGIVKTLFAHGADPTIVDSYGMTAVDYARQLSDPNWTDKFGNPAVGRWDDPSADSAIAEIIALLEH